MSNADLFNAYARNAERVAAEAAPGDLRRDFEALAERYRELAETVAAIEAEEAGPRASSGPSRS